LVLDFVLVLTPLRVRLLRLVAPPRNVDENADADRFEGDRALNVEDDDIGMGDMGLDMGVIGRGDGDISGSVART